MCKIYLLYVSSSFSHLKKNLRSFEEMDRTCLIFVDEDMVGKSQAGLLLAGSFFLQIFHFIQQMKKMETLCTVENITVSPILVRNGQEGILLFWSFPNGHLCSLGTSTSMTQYTSNLDIIPVVNSFVFLKTKIEDVTEKFRNHQIYLVIIISKYTTFIQPQTGAAITRVLR
jgi:hypothetical protein